jgi:hypothetical protein
LIERGRHGRFSSIANRRTEAQRQFPSICFCVIEPIRSDRSLSAGEVEGSRPGVFGIIAMAVFLAGLYQVAEERRIRAFGSHPVHSGSHRQCTFDLRSLRIDHSYRRVRHQLHGFCNGGDSLDGALL